MYQLTSRGLLLLILTANCYAEDISYPAESIINWNYKSFSGNTEYSVVYDDEAQRNVILAKSMHSASGLFSGERIDLDKTPWLNWSWRVEKFPTVNDEKEKAGDDFAARIYIVVNDGWTFLSTKTINYVWSQNNSIDDTWPNPFAGEKAMMIVVQTREQENGWVSEKRNIKKDLKNLFGKDYRYINAIAIMTDTDNTKSSATSYYSDIRLTED